MTAPEFSRLIDARQADGRAVTLTATPDERAALAYRFGLVRIDALAAEVALTRDGETVRAEGRLSARIVQSCAVSGEDLPVTVEEPIAIRFVPASPSPTAAEIELTAEQCDEIEYAGASFDLGEAAAQSLALAIDPFAVGPAAAEARRAAGLLDEGETGAFAGLGKLLKQ